jgi:hypothetical protein
LVEALPLKRAKVPPQIAQKRQYLSRFRCFQGVLTTS